MNKPLTIVLVLIGVLVLLVLTGALYVVDETRQVVITQFGEPIGEPVTKPGLKFKIPLIQRANYFEKRFLEWDGETNQIPTRDKRFIFVDSYARWQITDPLKFFQRLRDEFGAQSRLDDILDGETRNAIANYDLVEAVRTSNREVQEEGIEPEEATELEPISVGREKIRQEILRNAQTRTGDLGIEILDVQFKRINYAQDAVREALFNRMIAERKRIAARFRSEGEGEAARIRGEKEKEVRQILSEAYETSEEIRGDADAEATRIYAEAYDQSVDSRRFYELLQTLETYRSTFDPETTIILSSESEFYRFLKNSGG